MATVACPKQALYDQIPAPSNLSVHTFLVMLRNTVLEEHIYVCTFCWADWDREKLLEDWMSNAEDCCQRSGVQMPTPPPSGYNAWDTLPSPRTPRTTRSSVSSPDEISLSPTDGLALVRLIAMHDVMIHILYHSVHKNWKEYWQSVQCFLCPCSVGFACAAYLCLRTLWICHVGTSSAGHAGKGKEWNISFV